MDVPYICDDCQSGCLWKGILTALTSEETNYLHEEVPWSLKVWLTLIPLNIVFVELFILRAKTHG